jgi:glycosyltransferase involved in cell wall biosynthesis
VICAIIITTYTREKIIGKAIRSVPWADLILIVHFTNGEYPPDQTLAVAREAAGDRLRVIDIGEAYGCSQARNAGLDEATRLGATWALQLDTDEWVQCEGVNIRETLARVPALATVLMTWDSHQSYQKARFFRLPASGRFYGFSHEDWRPLQGVAILPPQITVCEIPKTVGKMLGNIPHILDMVSRDLEVEPDNPRWKWYRNTLLKALELKDQIDEHTMAEMLNRIPQEIKP